MNNTMNAPKVSVLIPVFNRKQFIAECIQSALNQVFTDFEIVVVDNASDDGTWEICQQFAALDQRVRIFRNETNIGPVRNWLRCAQEAKGELSKVLFSDDCLEPDCLSEMVLKLDDLDVALVYCAALIGVSRDNSTIAYSKAASSKLNKIQFYNLVLSGKAPVSPCAVLIRTTDLLKNLHTTFPTSTCRHFEKNGAGPDVMIMLLTALNYPYVVNISKPLVYFRAHQGSFSLENLNNDVIKGYRSVFSYFIINKFGRRGWFIYLGYLWIQQIKLDWKWVSPSRILQEYEGSGTTKEVLILIATVFGVVGNYFIRNNQIFLKSTDAS
jgi:glycosyltransferase involved in cell wall biosynthesis